MLLTCSSQSATVKDAPPLAFIESAHCHSLHQPHAPGQKQGSTHSIVLHVTATVERLVDRVEVVVRAFDDEATSTGSDGWRDDIVERTGESLERRGGIARGLGR